MKKTKNFIAYRKIILFFFLYFIVLFSITAVLVIFAPASMVMASPANIIASGDCGDNLTWVLYDDGFLEISGTGEMTEDYYSAHSPSQIIRNRSPRHDYLERSPWYDYREFIITVQLPDGLISIGNSAFYGCTNITSINIPDSVISIRDYAFLHCTSLEMINIPESVNYIGAGVFAGCKSLTSINVNTNNANYISINGVLFNKVVTFILQYPAGKIDDAYNIPESVTSIGVGAFNNCENLETITIPDNVISIGHNAFEGCTSLETINIPESIASIGDSAFDACESLETIILPNGLTSIGHTAFVNCASLETITIPESVTSIGFGAFAACESLITINVNTNNANYISINGVLFNKAVTVILQYPAGKTDDAYNIPESVISIENNAFYGCTNITSINIPDNVTFIGYNAFVRCTSLETINIPESVASIGSFAFAYCVNLTSINIPNSVTSIGHRAFVMCISLVQVSYEDPYGSNLTSIGSGAFEDCDSLSALFLPDSAVADIADDAIPDTTTVLGFYGSATIDWAVSQGRTQGAETDGWNYQPCISTMRDNPPHLIQRYIPYEYMVKTRIPYNERLAFTISPELPPGLEFDDTTGTVSGVITDPAAINTYNGREYTITAAAADLPAGAYSVSNLFQLELAGVPDDDITGWANLDDVGEILQRIGGENGVIEVDENGMPLVSPVIFEINAPFLAEVFPDGSAWEFHEFYINGMLQVRGTVKDDPDDGDYYAEEGSTIITIRDKTIQKLGPGDHTAAATFRRVDPDSGDFTVLELSAAEPWDINVEIVSQNFTITEKPGGGANITDGDENDAAGNITDEHDTGDSSMSNSSTNTRNLIIIFSASAIFLITGGAVVFYIKRRKTQKEKEGMTENPETKKANLKLPIIISSIGVVLVASAVMVLLFVIVPSNTYSEAVKYFDEGQYSQAYETLQKLNPDYKNTAELLLYYEAYVMFAEENYRRASRAFNRLDGYGDSRAMARESEYMLAQNLLESGEFNEALKLFAELGDYKDSLVYAERYAGYENTSISTGANENEDLGSADADENEILGLADENEDLGSVNENIPFSIRKNEILGSLNADENSGEWTELTVTVSVVGNDGYVLLEPLRMPLEGYERNLTVLAATLRALNLAGIAYIEDGGFITNIGDYGIRRTDWRQSDGDVDYVWVFLINGRESGGARHILLNDGDVIEWRFIESGLEIS